jgi:hypothetical protein
LRGYIAILSHDQPDRDRHQLAGIDLGEQLESGTMRPAPTVDGLSGAQPSATGKQLIRQLVFVIPTTYPPSLWGTIFAELLITFEDSMSEETPDFNINPDGGMNTPAVYYKGHRIEIVPPDTKRLIGNYWQIKIDGVLKHGAKAVRLLLMAVLCNYKSFLMRYLLLYRVSVAQNATQTAVRFWQFPNHACNRSTNWTLIMISGGGRRALVQILVRAN